MVVCIAEKPSVAREIANVLGAKNQKDGYLEGNGYQVTWTFGHLCELKEPHEYTSVWKNWSLSQLPMIPPRFGIKLKPDKGVEKQFSIIEGLFQNADEIINCGDAGQEGELIQRWVMQKAGAKCPVKRLWVNSLTEEAIKEAIAVAKEYGLPNDGEDSLEAKATKLIPDALMRKGTTLIKANDFANAVATLKEATEYDAQNGKIWLLLAQALIKTGADEEAVDALKSAAEFGQAQKANALLYKEYIKLGDAKKKERGGLNDALAYYDLALAIEENAQLVLKIANTQLQGGSNAKAISSFKRYLELSPDAENANDVIYTIAATAQKAGDNATAIQYYTKLKGDAKYGATATQMLSQLNK